MTPFWTTIVTSAVTILLSMLANIALFRYRLSKQEPNEELRQLRKDLVAVRGEVKYIQGILNGKYWKRAVD